ncbi:hypothetical protein HYU07_01225 [Candidatus Woesearchaeota archaeon]|nr:hypothetical protein [Candidatus Woesearchaeota archaeon]
MGENVWYGFAIGAIIGGGLGDDPPSGDSGHGLGAAKNGNSDKDSANGGQGLFSLWGHEIWLYLGGILGFGDKFGLYLTTGPMIGKNPDWAIGGGIHILKAFGLGVVVPIRQALRSYSKHQDKMAAYIDLGQQYLANAIDAGKHYLANASDIGQQCLISTQHCITELSAQMPTIASGLEQIIKNMH